MVVERISSVSGLRLDFSKKYFGSILTIFLRTRSYRNAYFNYENVDQIPFFLGSNWLNVQKLMQCWNKSDINELRRTFENCEGQEYINKLERDWCFDFKK